MKKIKRKRWKRKSHWDAKAVDLSSWIVCSKVTKTIDAVYYRVSRITIILIYVTYDEILQTVFLIFDF